MPTADAQEVSAAAPRPPRMHRRALLGLLLAACASCAAAPRRVAGPAPDVPPAPLHLVVLHTNDVHGQARPRPATWIDRDDPPPVGGLPRVAAYLGRARRDAVAEGALALAVDAGDWFQGTPEGALEQGAGFAAAMVLAGYDAMALGNHEFDHGVPALVALLERARLPAIAANVVDPRTGERVPWVEPWRLVELGRLTVALVGLVTTDTPRIAHPDARALAFVDPVEAFARAREELRGRADLVLPVGHVGVGDGLRLARANPDLPLVVTGHAHRYLAQGLREGGVLVVQAGEKATAVGRVDLWLDPQSLEVLRSEARLVELLDAPRPEDRVPAVEAAVAELVRAGDAALARVVGELTAPLRAGRGPGSTPAGSWVADLLRARTGADVAFHNRGGLRRQLGAGPVTARDLFELLPFDNGVVALTLRGDELWELVASAVEGRARSGLDYSGLRAVARQLPGGGLALERVEVAGEPLDRRRDYRVATNSFLAAGGDGLELLERGRDRRDDPILLRELALEAFERAGRVTPPQDERIAILPAKAGP